ncbi:MAG: Ig-like domain-containing protein [Muribaculum sp.]|nr:Ig-like domain-containing protein [Muribaculum sp.]
MKSNKKLLVRGKRFLAWLLAVAMVTGTLPASVASAAELPAVNTEDVSVLPVDEISADDAATTGDIAASDVSENDVTDNDVAAQVAEVDDLTDATVEEADKEIMAEGDTATTPSSKAVVEWDADELAEAVKDADFTYDYVAKQAEAAYKAKSDAAYTSLENSVNGVVTVKAGGKEVSATPTYAWQQNGAAVTGKPTAVGKYQLVATVAAGEGFTASDPTTVLSLEIKQAEVEISSSTGWTFRAGITVDEVKTNVTKGLTFSVNGATIAQGDITTGVDISVKEAYTDAVQADTTVLQKNQDYCVDVTVTLKEAASYKVGESRFNLILKPQTATEIQVTYTDAATAQAKGKVYDGNPLVYTTSEGGLDSAAAGFTAKVMYDKDDDGKCETELTGAVINGTWRDADKKSLAGDPVHAGVYYYLLTYSDENGTYEYASEYIRVEIEPAKIMVVPELPSDYKVYDGMYVSKILEQVDYKVYPVTANGGRGEAMSIDKNYFWGAYDKYTEDSDSGYGANQFYEPLFEVQRGVTVNGVQTWESYEDDVIVWQEEQTVKNPDNGAISTTTVMYNYRIVFTGNKGVYGNNDDAIDINESQGDYTVSNSLSVREAADNVFNITRSTATKVTINVDDICENGAGKTYDNPIERPYKGYKSGEGYKSIYKTRDEYKKAKVENGSGTLSYDWYYLPVSQSNVPIALDKDGKVVIDEDAWVENYDVEDSYGSWNNDVENYCSPYNAGVYRLKVSYNDSSKATYADPVYLYYVIRPQSAKVEIIGNPVIYADGMNTARDLLGSLQNENPDDKSTYVELKGYRVNATAKNAVTPFELKEGEVDPVQTLVEKYFNTKKTNGDYSYRYSYFCVERLQKETDTWEEVSLSDVLSKDDTYRISFDREYYNSLYTSHDSEYVKEDKTVYYTICANTSYSFGLQLDKCNQVLDKEFYENVPAKVAVTPSAATPITIDTSAFEGYEKPYDGKALDLNALRDKLKITAMVNGTETDITAEVKPLLKYVLYDSSDYETLTGNNVTDEVDANHNAVNAVHAGSYTVDIIFEANEKYQQNKDTTVSGFVINQKEISVDFELKDEIKAGVYFNGSIGYNADQTIANEILKSDNVENVYTFTISEPAVKVDAVMDGETEVRPAVDETDVAKLVGKPHNWQINKSTEKTNTNYSGYLKSSETYYVKVTGFEYGTYVDSLYGTMSYDRDYKVVSAEKSFTPVRAAAKVTAYDTALNDKVTESTAENVKSFTHTISAREDVPFNYDEYYDYNGTTKGQDSNIFRFNLWAPAEFYGEKSFTDNSYVYENVIKNIENAGGYVEARNTNYITVAFDLDLKKTVEFDVLFGKGYSEKYVIDLSAMVAEANMEQAVAPKSLAFNGAPKKLAVGEEVQLDVTVKKNQMSDVIVLGYSSDNEKVVQVSDTGYVTAVAKGSANISVYPCRRVGDGDELVEIKNGTKSYAKKLKITVTDVSKPKLSKVTGRDDHARITYTIPADGYRREVYVMAGKKKEADFVTAIANVKNGDYSAQDFVYVNLDLSEYENDDYYCDSKNVVSDVVIGGRLTPNTKDGYTVYLRNVAGLRTMEDGTEVAASAAGVVKNFKTTKSEAQALGVYFTDTKVVRRSTITDENGYYEYYKANFADKAAKVTVDAKFWERYSKTYSDSSDYIWRTLPLGADVKNSYNIPKMKFFVSKDDEIHDDRNENLNTSNMTKVDDHKWVYKTSLAKIDNSGKVTYLGKGKVYVLAYDTVSKCYDWLDLVIDANPNSVSAKAVKLQPGQSIWISSTLEYKEGKSKVVNYPYYCDLVTSTESNEYFKIEYVYDEYEQYDEHGGDYRVTALKAGGTINISVEDRVVKANGGSGTTLKITSPAVEPVKSAKVSAAYDDKFRVTFAYPTSSMYFRFELKNAGGKVITDTIQKCYGKWDAKSKKYIYTVNFGNTSEWSNWNEWKTRIDNEYTGNNNVSAVVNGRNRITLLSNYTVGITAVHCSSSTVNNIDKVEAEKSQMSKTVTVKAKTTNVPASYYDVDAYNLASGYSAKHVGGEYIKVFTNSNEGGYEDLSDMLLKAGNTYDLELALSFRGNKAAQKRMSDSLTWKSSNSKVASVKANTGTFTAKLVAGKQGTTTIEVTSKLTKKVIARWTVKIGAVGDAKNYFGENTPYGNDEAVGVANNSTNWANLKKNATKVTLNNTRYVSLQAGQSKCFVFEVPAYGQYLYGLGNNYGEVSWTTDGVNNDNWYDKGEKIYFVATNNTVREVEADVYVYGTAYTEIKLGDNTVPNGGNFVFRAPSDNYYTFTYVDMADATKTQVIGSAGYSMSTNETHTIRNSYLSDVPSGKDVTLRVTAREVKSTLTTAEAGNKVTLTNDQEVWYQFDATEDNLYTFSYEVKDGKSATVEYTDTLKDSGSSLSSYHTTELPMKANDKLYFAVSSSAATAEAPVEVTIKITKRNVVGAAPAAGAAEVDVDFTTSDTKFYTFTAATSGFYKFTATEASGVNLWVYTSIDDNDDNYAEYDNDSPVSVVHYLGINDTIYLGVKPDAAIPTDGKVTVKLKTEAVTTSFEGKTSYECTLNTEGQLTVYWKPQNEAHHTFKLVDVAGNAISGGSVSYDGDNYTIYTLGTGFYVSDPSVTGTITLNGTASTSVKIIVE